MSLMCDADGYDGDADWFWSVFKNYTDLKPLFTKRSRKCCSCKTRIQVGESCLRVRRWRPPSDRCDYIEESIYGGEVPLADWYLCETCADLAESLTELGFCFTLGDDSIASQIREYREMENYSRRKTKGAA